MYTFKYVMASMLLFICTNSVLSQSGVKFDGSVGFRVDYLEVSDQYDHVESICLGGILEVKRLNFRLSLSTSVDEPREHTDYLDFKEIELHTTIYTIPQTGKWRSHFELGLGHAFYTDHSVRCIEREPFLWWGFIVDEGPCIESEEISRTTSNSFSIPVTYRLNFHQNKYFGLMLGVSGAFRFDRRDSLGVFVGFNFGQIWNNRLKK